MLVSALSLLVNDQLRVFAVFLIGADQQKIHICGNAEASISAKFTFQLVAKIGCPVVKEFDGIPVGKAVCKVDVLAYKRVELFHLGHPSMCRSLNSSISACLYFSNASAPPRFSYRFQ